MRRAGWVCASLIVALLMLSFLPLDATTQNLGNRFEGPSAVHLLGTDHLGRDLFARVLTGAKYSVGLAVLLSLLCAAIGTIVGVVAAWLGGLVGAIVDRMVDSLVAVPVIIFGLILAATMGPGVGAVVVAVSIAGWTSFARLSRNLATEVVSSEYVLAARAYGQTGGPLLRGHVVPNIQGPLITLMCLRCVDIIFVIGGLSFLGVGIQLPTPEWGAMIADARPHLTRAPQVLLFPALGVLAVAVAMSVIGRSIVGKNVGRDQN